LAFAKILFLAEEMGLGERLKDKPLIWPMLFKSALFSVLLMTFNLLEKAIEHKFWPHAPGPGDEINMASLKTVLSVGIVMFVALIPFFGLRELGKVLGASQIYELFFVRRMRFAPLTFPPHSARLQNNPGHERGRLLAAVICSALLSNLTLWVPCGNDPGQ
jgi:hypothetical protein